MQKITVQKVEALRRLAKLLSRAEDICHSHALDRLAQDRGFKNWSMLQKNGVLDPESPQLSDFVTNNSAAAAHVEDEGVYLLRFLEGAPVALYRHRPGQTAEIVPTRHDLFNYAGGYSWGYHGSGPQNLSYALAGKIFQNERLSHSELSMRAMMLLENIISRLDGRIEYELQAVDLRQWATTSPHF